MTAMRGGRYLDAGVRRRLATKPALVVLDVDGTLLTSDHRITPPTFAAVRRAQAGGIQVMLATSRGPVALLHVLNAMDLLRREVFIASQGAVTARLTRSGDLHLCAQHPAPLTASRTLVRTAVAAGFSVNWFTGSRWLVSHVDRLVETESRLVGAVPEVSDLLSEPQGPDKLMLIAPPGDLAELGRIAAELPHGLVARTSGPRYLEITAAGVSKGSALRSYCASRGIPLEAVVAMGDGHNDLCMFEVAGTSVAPSSASPAALAAATFITRGNDEDGVAHALTALVGDD